MDENEDETKPKRQKAQATNNIEVIDLSNEDSETKETKANAFSAMMGKQSKVC